MGSFRFRRSVRIGPGVRMSVSKTGVGMSAGPRGARYSAHSSGRRTASVGAPGTGVGYVSSRGGRKQSSRGRAPQPFSPPKPGFFAPKHEKKFHKALQAYVKGDVEQARRLFQAASAEDEHERVLADDLLAGILSVQAERLDEAIPHLEAVVSSDVELPDELMTKYAIGGTVSVGVTERVQAEVVWGSLAAALALVECYQELGRLEEAIGVLQQLAYVEADPAIVLSLCDLYAKTGAWDEIVDLAAGIRNDNDITLEIKLLHARALREQGLPDAAFEVYKECLRSRKRSSDLLKEARYERAMLLLERGKEAQANKDLQAVYAEDPNYRHVRNMIRPSRAERAKPSERD